MLVIHSNGSKWAGEMPDSIEMLCEVLQQHPLDRTFEGYGNFYEFDKGIAYFFGNFFTLSHVFQIETDDAQTIARLTGLIDENRKRPDYLAQPDHKAEGRAP